MSTICFGMQVFPMFMQRKLLRWVQTVIKPAHGRRYSEFYVKGAYRSLSMLCLIDVSHRIHFACASASSHANLNR